MDTLTIIKRIEMRIAEIGMTKAEFYEKSGISSASYSQWKTGLYKPSIKKLNAAAASLGVSLDYLMGWDEKKPTPITEDELSAFNKLMKRVENLSPEQQGKVLDLVDFYLSHLNSD